ncbi:hypothetical protein [Mesorhizobium sp. WSM2239]|uniref:Uncharacterized protein n=2 Tax=unclassified Mesorhizobium TaxID=325217 RepID=A0AAU8D2N0_9HYPH
MHLGTFASKYARAAEPVERHGDSLTSLIFAIIVMFTVMASGFAVLQ